MFVAHLASQIVRRYAVTNAEPSRERSFYQHPKDDIGAPSFYREESSAQPWAEVSGDPNCDNPRCECNQDPKAALRFRRRVLWALTAGWVVTIVILFSVMDALFVATVATIAGGLLYAWYEDHRLRRNYRKTHPVRGTGEDAS